MWWERRQGEIRSLDDRLAALDQPRAIPAGARDDLGRALTTDAGPLVYQYTDLDKTVLAALARDGIQLFDPQKGTAFDLARGASALVGARVEQSAEQHVAGDSRHAVEVEDPSHSSPPAERAIRAAIVPAPKPSSMLTTATPAAHEMSIECSAVMPLSAAP